ncbi:hypothetical protein KP77_08680 [Jeotgalibacillus alimentarius]|uniref:Uncharacterized protein n=1 Tax=Jeotgalibacillus alimentarius TaxID=135826 RepID=A0A0C2W419_9BACL|nr:hypothetical protein [Jeotgalibacillus alimentarius]KIL51356.1 hypothetical protein KP77_08680 [Jeotgalibacillus alimentarius]
MMNENHVRTLLETMRQYNQSGITQTISSGNEQKLLVNYEKESDAFIITDHENKLNQQINDMNDAVHTIVQLLKRYLI